VARQEARGQGDQARRPGHPDHAACGAVLHGAGDREQRPGARRSPKWRLSAALGIHTPQAFSETFYAYLSQANNNGSAFAGYTGFIQPNAGNLGSHGITFADVLGGFDMVFARYAPILFALAVAGALAGKRVTPAGLGTMRTDNPTFVVLLIGVIILVGALTFFPALLLGPIVQGLTGHLY
jgi:K+-transporting ATPase A subunit